MSFAARIARDVVRVSGADSTSYLQGQVSQDVAGLTIGDSAWSFLLQPQGKVDAWLRVTRSAEDVFVLDVDGGWGEAVVRRLERFKMRVKVTIESLDWQCVAVRGVLPDLATLRETGADVLVPLDWGDEVGVDLLGLTVAVPDGVDEVVDGPAAEVYEEWRIRVGMPRMGAELDERTIPAEAGVVDRSVSFTKGCYTGQELVARVDSRGNNTPRNLRRVVLERPGVSPGDVLMVDGREAGVITSVVGVWALAYVRRQAGVLSKQMVAGMVGGVPARIEPLPTVVL